MTDPHAPPPDLEDLFRRARLDVGEPERLARVAAKLPGRPGFPWLKLAGGGALVAALGLAGASLSRPRDLPAPSSLPPMPSETLPQASALAPPESSPEPSSAPAISGSSGYQTSPAPSSSPPASSSRPPRQAASATGGDIMEEHALLAEARRALGSSPASALALVQQHQQRFPRGQLGVEREFLRIQALHRLGRSAEARAAGERFLRSFPRSPYAAEVERLLR